jgi:hypothetical protein
MAVNDNKKIEEAQKLGANIGFWLAALCRDEDELNAWAAVMSTMSEEDLKNLAVNLENLYLIAKAGQPDPALQESMRQIQQKYFNATITAETTALNAMAQIEDELKQAAGAAGE